MDSKVNNVMDNARLRTSKQEASMPTIVVEVNKIVGELLVSLWCHSLCSNAGKDAIPYAKGGGSINADFCMG